MSTTAPRIDRVSVSWNEEWDLARYLERYLVTRRLSGNEHARAALQECLDRYPGVPPFRKSDLDYFLDANFARAKR